MSFNFFENLSFSLSMGWPNFLVHWVLFPSQNQRIRGLLEKCTLDHEARIENLHNELRERALSDARWKQIQELSESVCTKFIIM